MLNQLNNTITPYEVNPIDPQHLLALIALSQKPSTLLQVMATTGINIGKLAPWVHYLKEEGFIVVTKNDICPIGNHLTNYFSAKNAN